MIQFKIVFDGKRNRRYWTDNGIDWYWVGSRTP